MATTGTTTFNKWVWDCCESGFQYVLQLELEPPTYLQDASLGRMEPPGGSSPGRDLKLRFSEGCRHRMKSGYQESRESLRINELPLRNPGSCTVRQFLERPAWVTVSTWCLRMLVNHSSRIRSSRSRAQRWFLTRRSKLQIMMTSV